MASSFSSQVKSLTEEAAKVGLRAFDKKGFNPGRPGSLKIGTVGVADVKHFGLPDPERFQGVPENARLGLAGTGIRGGDDGIEPEAESREDPVETAVEIRDDGGKKTFGAGGG